MRERQRSGVFGFIISRIEKRKGRTTETAVPLRANGKFGDQGEGRTASADALRQCVCAGPRPEFAILPGSTRISPGVRREIAGWRALGGGVASGRDGGAGAGGAEARVDAVQVDWAVDAGGVCDGRCDRKICRVVEARGKVPAHTEIAANQVSRGGPAAAAAVFRRRVSVAWRGIEHLGWRRDTFSRH